MAISWYTLNWDAEQPPEDLFLVIERQLASIGVLSEAPSITKKAISGTFLEEGWVENFKLPESNLYVSFKKDRVACCVQLGNVARVYADLLKLQNLYDRDVVDTAVLLVPSDELSRRFGANHASFGRTVRDLETLSKSLTCPILVMSLEIVS